MVSLVAGYGSSAKECGSCPFLSATLASDERRLPRVRETSFLKGVGGAEYEFVRTAEMQIPLKVKGQLTQPVRMQTDGVAKPLFLRCLGVISWLSFASCCPMVLQDVPSLRLVKRKKGTKGDPWWDLGFI